MKIDSLLLAIRSIASDSGESFGLARFSLVSKFLDVLDYHDVT